MRSALRILTLAGLAAIGTSMSFSAQAVNRCVDAKGKVTYQDAACDGQGTSDRPVDTTDAFSAKPGRLGVAPTIRAAESADPAYQSAKGAWRGPVQFQYSLAGVRDDSAQTVTPMVIELKTNGEVVGVISEGGCKLSGLTTQFVAPYIANVDVSLKGCRDARFNARFSGFLHANAAAREAKLTLNAISWQVPNNKVQQASLEAVLRR